jgi:hypothetical protein
MVGGGGSEAYAMLPISLHYLAKVARAGARLRSLPLVTPEYNSIFGESRTMCTNSLGQSKIVLIGESTFPHLFRTDCTL